MQINQRRLIAIVAVLAGSLLLWFIVDQLSHIGKTAVTVETSPQDASIMIDGHGANTGVNYLSNGEHIFTAAKEGYKQAEQTVTINTVNNYVALLPEPVSQAAIKEASSDKESSWAQTISGIASSRSGEALRAGNPIVKQLPYSDISGPFKIDYGYNQDNKDTIYLIVSYASPDGRQKAIEWLKQHKVDVTMTEIVFADFINPAATNKEHHD